MLQKAIFKNRALTVLFLLFVILNGVLAFWQYSNDCIDGDLTAIVVPFEGYQKVLDDPFGFSALCNGEIYAAPNRFFAHFSMREYFLVIPALLQKINISPIASVYLSCALIKFLAQMLVVLAIWLYIKNISSVYKGKMLFVFVLLLPLFQTGGFGINFLNLQEGFGVQMGLVDHSITYSFFYIVPISFFLFFLYPFYLYFFYDKSPRYSVIYACTGCLCAIFFSLNSPIITGIILVIAIMFFVKMLFVTFNKAPMHFAKNIFSYLNSFPRHLIIVLFFTFFASAYSFYIGTFNYENTWEYLPLSDRFLKLAIGIVKILSVRMGLPVLVVIIIANTVIIKRKQMAHVLVSAKLFSILRYLLLFCFLYVLLLPLGGYRSYRPYIIRYDTFIPVTICIIFYFVASTLFVLQILETSKLYVSIIVITIILFTYSNFQLKINNKDEKAMLYLLSETKADKLDLPTECSVLSWGVLYEYESSKYNAVLLKQWKITHKLVLYRYKK